MWAMPRLLVPVAASFLLAAPAASTTTSGLYGKVTRGPLTPVCTIDQPCYGPAAGVTLSFVRSSTVTGRVTTAKDGTYRIRLAPGTYAVLGPKRMTPTTARVYAGRVVRQNFSIDTGIR